MSHLYEASSWQSASGYWYVNDIKELASVGSKWYTPMRMLDISVEKYIELLRQYKAINIKYNFEHNVLVFNFETKVSANKFKNYLNKKAREKRYIV